MSGICTLHPYHEPECKRCTAFPYDSHYEEHMGTIEVNLPEKTQAFLFREISRLNCRPSDFIKYAILEFMKSHEVPGETDNPDV